MSLRNLALKTAPVISVTGTDDDQFLDDGVTINNGVRVMADPTEPIGLRRSIVFKHKPHNPVGGGLYSKSKKTISCTRPFTGADGKPHHNTLRIEFDIDPEAPATAQEDLRIDAVQVCTSAAISNFLATGSTQ